MALNTILLTLIIVPIIISAIVVIVFMIVALVYRMKEFSVSKNTPISNSTAAPDPSPEPIPDSANEPAPIETKSFPEILKSHRIARHMSQEYLAEQLGVTRQAVSKWESGTSEPSTANLLALAKLYGISLDELVGLK